MTLDEAMALHGPAWLSLWLPILFGGAFILPLSLLIWKSSRVIALICAAASLAGAIATNVLYTKLGYVKLLGLPHIIVWTPLVIFLLIKFKSEEIAIPAKIIMSVITLVGEFNL